MDTKKDIGKAFQERLEGFEKSPTKTSWENIEVKLDKEKNDRFTYWIPMSLVGILFLVLLIQSINYPYKTSPQKTTTDSITDSESLEDNNKEVTKGKASKKIVPTKDSSIKNQESLINIKSKKITSTNKDKESVYNNTNSSSDQLKNVIKYKLAEKKNDVSKQKDAEHLNFTQSSSAFIQSEKIINNQDRNKLKLTDTSKASTYTIAKNDNVRNIDILPSFNKPSDTLFKSQEKDSIIAAKKAEIIDSISSVPKKNKTLQRFSIGAHIIPAYNIVPAGSLINNDLAKNPNQGNISIGYGILFTSHFGNRFSSRIGYNKITLKNEIKNIEASSTTAILGSIGIQTTPEINEIINNAEFIDLSQKINYHEISMEMGYELINKKIKTYVVGGVSLLIEENTKISIIDPQSITIGSNNKISKTNFSLNFGSSLQYNVFKSINLYIEPMIKYNLQNASNNSESYNPLYFTLQTGFSFQF
ncbi:hypothetical protein [Aquimarina sp. MMG016]|uniref:hypothetical protein n=1 Tax=Aquimarina sp. MMG016 TaxID=2822690 RepID=UPI001B3A5EFA|nr:hypothetical protein [Aquimarina sp. MMG016]MBQ4822327.1 hypothetical protein [Aquimarina sp. MMG016]